ncbi:endonuclease/exonuclease/phosphatase family protein [Nocardia sp. CNY236]|uniref:endonuclease/exonuclease/phosphatase family protein n=1 Tax=Nocardia sp. CNY236 TaxID=1169152 RepID=UPI00048BECB7
MTDLDEQGMLFGALGCEREPRQPTDALRICALNVASPSRSRAHKLAQWLLTRGDDVLILTEMRTSHGCRDLLASLRAEGYDTATNGASRADNDRFCSVIATRGVATTPVPASLLGPRVTAVDIGPDTAPVRVVAVYAPTNGMNSDSSRRRSVFQHRVIDYLRRITLPTMVVAGDFNVIEPGHNPRLPQFQPHDYQFYIDLLGLGLRDAYRELHPETVEYSWFSRRFGNQRIDHTFTRPGTNQITACAYDHSTREHAGSVTVGQCSGALERSLSPSSPSSS